MKRTGRNGISLCISKMSYTYHNGTKVFMRADFEAHPHEIVALVGPSGEGKTTLLRIMLALLHIQSGDEDLVGAKTGEVLTITPAARRLFSYVPQEIQCFPARLRKICGMSDRMLRMRRSKKY